MTRCYLLDGRFEEVELGDLGAAAVLLEERRKELHKLDQEDIIELLGLMGREMIRDPALSAIEGGSYISMWLRKENLRGLCRTNYGGEHMLDRFCEVRPGLEMRAQPRGVSCHWLPNNVATMSIFSLLMAILSKNASLLKVSEVSRPVLTAFLKAMASLTAETARGPVPGEVIVRTVAMISFDSSSIKDNEAMSMAADVKIAWGSGEAVRAVVALPQKETCDTLVFGPKYSLAVFDQAYLSRADLPDALRRLAIDAALFDQTACSSPQVVFVEKGERSSRWFAEALAKGFEALPVRLRSAPLPEPLSLRVINARGAYLLDESRDVVMPKDLGWTVLLDRSPGLPEPVQGRCVFVREADDLGEVAERITRKVQTVAICIDDPRKRQDFTDKASYRGVDRFVQPGEMNDFTLPWDGLMPLGRMVRWVTIRRK